MAFTWNRFAYTNFHELNLDWFNEHFKEIFEEWEELYNTLTQWKDDTDADLAQWKEDTLSDMDTWERELLATLDEWKVDTGNDISDWESGVISDLNDWKETFLSAYESLEDRVEAIVSDTEDMVENLAEPFSAEKSYLKGDYVVQNGVLYQFLTNHSAGAWNSSEVVQSTAMNDITDIIRALAKYNSADVIQFSDPVSRTNFTVEFDFHSDKSCTVHGTATNVASGIYFSDPTSIPAWIELGKTYKIKFSSTNVLFQIWDYSGGNLTKLLETKTDTEFTFPNNLTGLLIRLCVTNGQSANETVRPYMISAMTNDEIEDILANIMYARYVEPVNNAYTLSNISTPGMYIPDVSYPTTDAPTNFSQRTYYLEVESFNYQHIPNRFTKQTVYGVGSGITGKIYYRTSNYSGVYGEWRELGSANNYTFNEYSQTLNVTATPTITTDTNSYLAPSGDTTDRTSDILTLLNTTGVCRLGKGNYYIKNLVMPERTSIIGAGHGTSIRLLTDNDAQFAIKMNSFCVLENFGLYGLASSFTPNANPRGRDGIIWQGEYTDDQTAPYRSMIKTLWIYNFEGSAIKCYDTGYGGDCSINVDDVYIWSCDAGINIAYWSEFNKFTNVRASACYYGCINNGGNNVFANCDFSSNKLCFFMDNGNSQSPNNSHGSCTNCLFNHADSNNGTGIKIVNCENGFVFEGCQLFYSQLDFEDSDGIIVANCNFGSNNCVINISGGGSILFNGNMHGGTPTKNISGNSNVHFANCYVRSSGTVVS